MATKGFSFRLLGLAVVLVLALGALGCGGDDGDGESTAASGERSSEAGGAGKEQSGGSTKGAPKPAADLASLSPDSDEGKVKAVYLGMQRSLNQGDAERTCAYLTPKAQKDSAVDAGEPTCVAVAKKIIDAYGSGAKVKQGELLDIEVKGDAATVTVRSGDRLTATADFAKTPAGWKFAAPLLPRN